MLPVVPTPAEEKRFFSLEDTVRGSLPARPTPIVAAPTAQPEELCGLAEEANRLLEALGNGSYLAPAPEEGYTLDKSVHAYPALTLIYRAFQSVVLDHIPIATVRLGRGYGQFEDTPGSVRMIDTSTGLVYEHELEAPSFRVWVENAEGKKIGYIQNSWVFKGAA